MKVLLITDNHTPSGGAEKYFFALKARLKARPGIEVYSIGFGPQETSGDDYFVLKATQSNLTKLIWHLLFNPLVYRKLRKKIREINPDIIHLHNIKQYTAALFKAIAPYPVVQTMHDYSSICPVSCNIHKNGQVCTTGLRLKCLWQHRVKYNRFTYLLLVYAFLKVRRQLKKTVRQLFAPSPLLVNYLEKNHFPKTLYLPPFTNTPSAPSFSTMKPYHFLFAGNLGVHKGVHLLVEEFASACRQNSNLTLTIAGTGPEKEKLEKSIKKHGLEKKVSFIGWQNNLDKHYEEAIAVIFPSIGMESFGMVITEAMSHARPIIGSNRGTSAWLIDDHQTGLLFDPLKKGDLADKLLTLAGNLDLAMRLGSDGFDKLQKFIDNEESLDKIVEVYKLTAH